MKVTIESPTSAYLDDYTPNEFDRVKEQLSYKNGKIEQLLKRHLSNSWWRRKNPTTWEERKYELQSELDASLLEKDARGYKIKPGYLPYLKMVKLDITNNIVQPELKPLPWIVEPEFEPYPYQANSVKRLLDIGHGNVSLPTGCGKSFILLMLAQQIGEGVVVVTPSKSIFMELLEEFQLRLGKSKVGGYGNGKKDIKKPITIAIGKSITMLEEGTDAYEFFANKKAVLVDESHTWGADKLEGTCHGVLADAPRRFFVSATQTRGDGMVKLLHSIIGETVLEMSIEEAIRKKYLCPLKFSVISTYSPSTKTTREVLEMKREHYLYNDNIAQYAAKIANAKWRAHQESTLILVEELVQIHKLTKLLEVPFTYIHSGSKKEAAKNGLEKVDLKTELERFNSGEVKVLIGTKSISTGTNIYPTHNVINWVGGGSEITTKQGTMGRSTRWMKAKYKDKHKEKTFSQIWDFDVTNQPILQRMLQTRIKYYQETGEKVGFVG
jgi:superfamily II DNA or RNA helicase